MSDAGLMLPGCFCVTVFSTKLVFSDGEDDRDQDEKQ